MNKTKNDHNKKVLVTGANGFIASHCIKKLLKNNYHVIGTVRNINDNLIKNLLNIYPEKKMNLEIVVADLFNKDCWDEIIKRCEYALHIACPVFALEPKNKEEILKKTIKATKTILKSCIKNKIKKVILTSSISAMNIQKDKNTLFYNEKDYTDKNYDSLYAKLKLLTEKEAWKIY